MTLSNMFQKDKEMTETADDILFPQEENQETLSTRGSSQKETETPVKSADPETLPLPQTAHEYDDVPPAATPNFVPLEPSVIN